MINYSDKQYHYAHFAKAASGKAFSRIPSAIKGHEEQSLSLQKNNNKNHFAHTA